MYGLLILQASQSGSNLINFFTLIAEHKGLILLLSSVISLIFAIVMLAPFRRGAVEKWAQYFGGGFAVFFLQYAIRCTAHLLINYHWVSPDHIQYVRLVEHVIVVFCSAGNNLLFLAAALTLFGSRDAFPLQALIIAGISLVAVFDLTAWQHELVLNAQPSLIYYELLSIPDTIFSTVCLTLVAYATATTALYRRFPLLAAFSILVGIIYGFIHIVNGFNPSIFDSVWINHYLPIASFFGNRGRLTTVLFAVALILKFGLFLPGYVLHQRSLTAFYDIQDMLGNMVRGRDEFISSGGIVRVIGQRFGADIVDLSIRLPGKEKEQIASIVWGKDTPEEDRKNTTVVKNLKSSGVVNSDERNPPAEAVIKWGLEIREPFLYPETTSRARKIYRKFLTLIDKKQSEYIHDTQVPEDVKEEFKDKKAMMLIPIQFHGASIGCIKVERNKPTYKVGKYVVLHLPFSNSARHVARQLADLAAPSVQAYRELATLDQLSLRLTQALSLVAAKATTKTSKDELYNSQKTAKLLIDILQDVLSPEAMRFVIDFGFTSTTPEDTGEQEYIELLQQKLGNKKYEDLPKEMEDHVGNRFKLYKRELSARVPETNETRSEEVQFRLGYLVLPVRLDNDKFKKPMLGANYLHRKTVASILGDAILDFARAFFDRQLRELTTKLNDEEQLDVQQWFNDIEETAKNAGLLWLVTNRQDGELIGSDEGTDVVKLLMPQASPQGYETQSLVRITSYKITPPIDKTHHVLLLDLPNSEYRLWLGVSRPSFEKELKFASPWQNFLQSYGEIADAGLVRFTAAQEFQKLQIEAAQYQGLATVAVTMGTLAHQLTNMARNQSAACSTLENILDMGVLQSVEVDHIKVTLSEISGLIRTMKRSADKHMNLLEAFAKVTKVDDRRPCSLVEAVHQAVTLFQTALLQSEIDVKVDVDPAFRIDVPFYVAALGLGNLISNAKDAMGTGKTIWVKAYERDGGISCQVRDEGSGIDPKLKPHIFNLGVTTKPYSGGWGLYLVKRSLLENGANIELTETNQNGTTFTIWFPSPPADFVI
jgi:signal transduction histidine kinase